MLQVLNVFVTFKKAFNLENIEILDLILKILESMFTFP